MAGDLYALQQQCTKQPPLLAHAQGARAAPGKRCAHRQAPHIWACRHWRASWSPDAIGTACCQAEQLAQRLAGTSGAIHDVRVACVDMVYGQ